MSNNNQGRLIGILRSIYRELRHYDFGPGVGVRKSDTWRYIMEIARRNRITAMQNCQEGSEWPRIAETYLIYTQSSRKYGEMLGKHKESRSGKTLIDAIKSQSAASSVLFDMKTKKPELKTDSNSEAASGCREGTQKDEDDGGNDGTDKR